MSFETFFGSNSFNLYQLITPYKGSKNFLLYYRIFVFIILCYGLFTSIYVYYYPNPNDKRRVYFAYFTNQTYFCIMIYFAVRIKYILLIIFFLLLYYFIYLYMI